MRAFGFWLWYMIDSEVDRFITCGCFPFCKFCELPFQDCCPYFYERMHLLFDIFTWKRTICQICWKLCSSFNLFTMLLIQWNCYFTYSNLLIFVLSSFHVMHKKALPHPNIYSIPIFNKYILRIYHTSKQRETFPDFNLYSRIIKTMALFSIFNTLPFGDFHVWE